MESVEQHIHTHSKPDNSHPESPELTHAKKIFAASDVEFNPIAEEYISLDDGQLRAIIAECEEDLAQNEEYVENLRNSDQPLHERQERIHHAQRGSYNLNRRKQTAELILNSRD